MSDEYLGLVVVRPYTKAEIKHKNIRIGAGKILDLSFDNSSPNFVAVLSEDQSITIWKVNDFDLEQTPQEFKAEGTLLTHLKWNPYNPNEIVAFSEHEIFLIKRNKPVSGIRLPVSEAVSDITFIPEISDCISFTHQLDFLIIPKNNKKVLLGHYDSKERKLITSDFGITITQPVFIFNETEKSTIALIDANEFKEITIKPSSIEKIVNTIPLHDLVPKGSGPFVPYYNMKTMLVYLVFPESGAYSILRHKKKKFASHVNGTINPFSELDGIIGLFNKEAGDVIYLYNSVGIYSFMAKKFVSNSEKSPIITNQPKEPKEEKKDKKGKSAGTYDKSHLRKESKETLVPEDASARDLIRKEIDGAIKTTVLPVIESHMKRFEGEFQGLITREIAQLKKVVQEETDKMQSTGKVFEGFMERMLDISAKFTGNLEGQMKELAFSSRPNLSSAPSYASSNVPANYNDYKSQAEYYKPPEYFDPNQRIYKP